MHKKKPTNNNQIKTSIDSLHHENETLTIFEFDKKKLSTIKTMINYKYLFKTYWSSDRCYDYSRYSLDSGIDSRPVRYDWARMLHCCWSHGAGTGVPLYSLICCNLKEFSNQTFWFKE